MGEDLDRERKIFITTTSSGIEIPGIIKEFDIEQYQKDISTLSQMSIDEVEFRIQQAFIHHGLHGVRIFLKNPY